MPVKAIARPQGNLFYDRCPNCNIIHKEGIDYMNENKKEINRIIEKRKIKLFLEDMQTEITHLLNKRNIENIDIDISIKGYIYSMCNLHKNKLQKL